jgi:DNA replication factor GINS
MYNRLYEIWKSEIETDDIVKLPQNFYSEVVEYLRRLREERRMLDRKTVKASLLQVEMRNAKRMIRELIHARYRKLMIKMAKCEKVSEDVLTQEERKFHKETLSFAEAYRNFAKEILHGHVPKLDASPKHRLILRFLKDVPAIVGADMKVYGPFKAEDIASVPVENAKILSRKGMAEVIETENN